MNFATPSADGSTETETETETTTETYDGRMDDMEEYWGYVDTERFLQKMCVAFGVAVDDGFARYTEAEGESPLADHGLFYYRQKKELGNELRDQREGDELNDDQNLPAYRDQFETPEYDYTEVSADNAEDFGLDADQFEDDEVMYVPEEYEPETNDDNELIVWYNTDGDYTKDDVLEALNDVSGIGPKKAGKALNALQDAGIVASDI